MGNQVDAALSRIKSEINIQIRDMDTDDKEDVVIGLGEYLAELEGEIEDQRTDEENDEEDE